MLWAPLEGASLLVWDQRVRHTPQAPLGQARCLPRGQPAPPQAWPGLTREQWSLLRAVATGRKALLQGQAQSPSSVTIAPRTQTLFGSGLYGALLFPGLDSGAQPAPHEHFNHTLGKPPWGSELP